MFKKISESGQLNIFISPEYFFSGTSHKIYKNKQARLNQFRKQFMWIDKNTFQSIYYRNNGIPNPFY